MGSISPPKYSLRVSVSKLVLSSLSAMRSFGSVVLLSRLYSAQVNIGPASSSATILIIVTPVVLSPAKIADLIGSAPLCIGRREKWLLSMPRLKLSITVWGIINP